jgi:adenine/guanine phosphoribosyltransferase-like PRPP-binding protein
MFSELSVTIKDDEKRLNKKFTIYDTYQVDEDDPTIKQCINEVLENFDGTPDSVKVIITLEMQ